MGFMESDVFTWILLPALIFFSRIFDVTLGTMRIIWVSRGHRVIAPILGFFEVLIWIIVIMKIMENLGNWPCILAYAAGFATGNYVGIRIEEKLAVGTYIVRVITRKESWQLIRKLNDAGFGATTIPAQGKTGPVHVIYTIIKRGSINKVIDMINEFNPKAFYSIEDVRYVSEGIFPLRQPMLGGGFLPKIRRRGK